jgi:hypothetical protein
VQQMQILVIKRIIFSMSRIFDEMCSKPEIFLAFLSKSNYSMIIVSTVMLSSKLCLAIEKPKGI